MALSGEMGLVSLVRGRVFLRSERSGIVDRWGFPKEGAMTKPDASPMVSAKVASSSSAFEPAEKDALPQVEVDYKIVGNGFTAVSTPSKPVMTKASKIIGSG